jgi:ketosteroid isomerase-like protein
MRLCTISVGVVVLLFAAVSTAAAQTALKTGAAASRPTISSASTATKQVETAISQLEREWAAAIVKADRPALDHLLAAEFNGTSATGHTFPKAMAIEELQSGKYKVESMAFDEITVNVYGDVAVAFTSQTEKSHYAGQDTGGHYHFTDVWARKGGQWQVVASHGSRVNLED